MRNSMWPCVQKISRCAGIADPSGARATGEGGAEPQPVSPRGWLPETPASLRRGRGADGRPHSGTARLLGTMAVVLLLEGNGLSQTTEIVSVDNGTCVPPRAVTNTFCRSEGSR
mgnify:CR=1 FL=1